MNNRVSRLLVATHNKGKIAEYAGILGDLQIEWLTLDEAGVTREVDETGQTFLENAILKAVTYARQTGLYTLADDSGLEVDYLAGQPGVKTARYGGTGLTAAERYEVLLKNLAGVPWEDRTARFRCVVALADRRGEVIHTTEGVCEGIIALNPVGEGGFGYDPVFFLPERGLTMAQLTLEEKHQISHRGRAAYNIAPAIRIAMKGV
jgi:XTP/dITP diphosphohydrolase